MTTIIFQRFANREYRLTNQSLVSPRKKRGDKYAEVQQEKYAQAVHNTYVLGKNLDEGFTASCEQDGVRFSAFGEVEAQQALRSLDIINEFQTVQKVAYKGGWGILSKPTQFTKNARHRLLEAGAVVEKACGKNAWEVTVTIPGSLHEGFKTVASWSGYIMNELTQILRRAKCQYWFYVWELQKRGALHLHLLIADPEKDLSELSSILIRRWWGLLMSLSEKCEVDIFAKSAKKTWKHTPSAWQSHSAKIEKSIAAYFSKYAGKTATPSSSKGTGCPLYAPSRWWGSSSIVKRDIAANRWRLVLNVSRSQADDIEKYLLQHLATAGRIKNYYYEFELGVTANGTNLGGGRVHINYYNDAEFARLQTWDKWITEYLTQTYPQTNADMGGTQTWTDADMEAEYILRNRFADRPAVSPSPHSQPSPLSRKLRKSRGTQAKPTLDLRARLIEFLAGGMGERPIDMSGTQTSANADMNTQTWTQTSLFDVRRYEQS